MWCPSKYRSFNCFFFYLFFFLNGLIHSHLFVKYTALVTHFERSEIENKKYAKHGVTSENNLNFTFVLSWKLQIVKVLLVVSSVAILNAQIPFCYQVIHTRHQNSGLISRMQFTSTSYNLSIALCILCILLYRKIYLFHLLVSLHLRKMVAIGFDHYWHSSAFASPPELLHFKLSFPLSSTHLNICASWLRARALNTHIKKKISRMRHKKHEVILN